MKKSDFEMLHKMVEFMRGDLRHCIGADANWVTALALVAYTEVFGHFLLPEKSTKPYECFNECLEKWMHYSLPNDPKNPGKWYDRIRNGLAHEYLMKTDSEVNMGTGPSGIEIIKRKKGDFIRLNLVTYYNDFMEAVKAYEKKVKTDANLQKAFDRRMEGKPRLR